MRSEVWVRFPGRLILHRPVQTLVSSVSGSLGGPHSGPRAHPLTVSISPTVPSWTAARRANRRPSSPRSSAICAPATAPRAARASTRATVSSASRSRPAPSATSTRCCLAREVREPVRGRRQTGSCRRRHRRGERRSPPLHDDADEDERKLCAQPDRGRGPVWPACPARSAAAAPSVADRILLRAGGPVWVMLVSCLIQELPGHRLQRRAVRACLRASPH
jgi:hypothetical protein